MSNVQMSAESIRVIRFLAEEGPKTLDRLMQKFPGQARKQLVKRLRTLTQRWWTERYLHPVTGQMIWRVNPASYNKLHEIGVRPPAARTRTRQHDWALPYDLSDGVAQPRRINVFSLPTLSGYMSAQPLRAGAMAAAACPSRGFRC